MEVLLTMPNSSLPALARDILEGVRSRPGRFGLSLFAMSIGMGVLTALIALLLGLESRAEQLSAQLGTNVIAVLSAPAENARPLLSMHADLLRRNYPGTAISGLKRSVAHTPGTDRSLSVIAVEDAFFDIRQWPVTAGRVFDRSDILERQRYAVVSTALLKEQQWELGSTILLGHTPFLIIGVVGPNDSALAGEYGDSRLTTGENTVFVPLSAGSQWDNQMALIETVDELYIRPPEELPAGQLLQGLKDLLSQPDLRLQGLSWVIPASLIKNVTQMQDTVGLAVGAIAILCLILGGTTLTSLMVANVRERIAEIGLRRAVGATEIDIALLFVTEGCVATVCAAIIGSLSVHVLIARDLEILSRMPLEWGIETIVLPIALSLVLGTLFSFWPAVSAARISPAEALRAD